MKQAAKTKQIVVRFSQHSYDLICVHARTEHRGIGEFVRHAALDYIEKLYQGKTGENDKEADRHENNAENEE